MSLNKLKNKLYGLINDKDKIASAIRNKGISVPYDAKLSEYPTYINYIASGDHEIGVYLYYDNDETIFQMRSDGSAYEFFNNGYNANDIVNIQFGNKVTNICRTFSNYRSTIK